MMMTINYDISYYFLTIIYNDAAAADEDDDDAADDDDDAAAADDDDDDAADDDDDDVDHDNDDIWTITNMSYVSRHWTTNLEETLYSLIDFGSPARTNLMKDQHAPVDDSDLRYGMPFFWGTLILHVSSLVFFLEEASSVMVTTIWRLEGARFGFADAVGSILSISRGSRGDAKRWCS